MTTTLTGWTPDATMAAGRALEAADADILALIRAETEPTPILDGLLSELPDPWPVVAGLAGDIAARRAAEVAE